MPRRKPVIPGLQNLPWAILVWFIGLMAGRLLFDLDMEEDTARWLLLIWTGICIVAAVIFEEWIFVRWWRTLNRRWRRR